MWKEFVKSGDQNASSFPGKIDNTLLFDGKCTYTNKYTFIFVFFFYSLDSLIIICIFAVDWN